MNSEFILNPHWRINHLYSVVDKHSEKVIFKENSIQKILNASFKKRRLVLKARQFGISTNEIIRLFDDTIWTPNRTNVILAHEQDSIKKLFRIARRAYDFLDEEARPILSKGGGSQYEMFFPEINSRIYCDLEVRGDTISNLHVSECAFMKDPLKLRATLQAVPLHGRVTVETTPNGMGNFFYDMWQDPESIYAKFFFPWYLFPDYKLETPEIEFTRDELELIQKAKTLFNVEITKEQIAFRRLKKQELKETFIQEYPEDDQTCFLSSGESAFDLQIVKRLFDNATTPLSDDGEIKIYKTYDKTKRYVCGADTAEGVSGDYSVGVILDANSREQCAVLRGHFRPIDFAHKLKSLCEKYVSSGRMWPLLAVERNNHGHAVLLELKEHIHYHNLYHTSDGKPGWLTDRVTRPIMINDFRHGVENETLKVHDKTTLSECLTLVNKQGKIEAADSKHDDCVIANAIALQMCFEMVDLDIYKNIDKKILL